MPSHQEIEIIGHLARDPELKYTQGGTPFCNMSIPVNDVWTDKEGQRQESTTWFRTTAWGKIAETLSDLAHKGTLIMIKGEMQADESGGPKVYQKNDGSWAASYEIKLRKYRLLNDFGRGETRAAHSQPDDDEVIPF